MLPAGPVAGGRLAERGPGDPAAAAAEVEEWTDAAAAAAGQAPAAAAAAAAKSKATTRLKTITQRPAAGLRSGDSQPWRNMLVLALQFKMPRLRPYVGRCSCRQARLDASWLVGWFGYALELCAFSRQDGPVERSGPHPPQCTLRHVVLGLKTVFLEHSSGAHSYHAL
eukprot:488551-Pelagomonas_calceolata.AAC.3